MVISSILTLSLNAVKPVELPKHLPQQTAIEEKAKNSLLQVPSNTAHETETTYTFVLDAQKSQEQVDLFLEGLVSGADRPKTPSNTAGTPTPSDDPERGDGRREN